MPFNNPSGGVPPNGSYFDTGGAVSVPIDGVFHQLFTVDNVILDADRFYMGHFFGTMSYNRNSGGILAANSRNLNAFRIAWTDDPTVDPITGGGLPRTDGKFVLISPLKYLWLIPNPTGMVGLFNPHSADATWNFVFKCSSAFIGSITFWAEWTYFDFFGPGGSAYILQMLGSDNTPRGFYITDVSNGYPLT